MSVSNKSAEEIKHQLENNHKDGGEKLALVVESSAKGYGYVVWYRNDGTCMSCMSLNEDNLNSHWGVDEFDESNAYYDDSRKSIIDGSTEINVKPRKDEGKFNDANLTKEIESQRNRIRLVNFNDTVVGRLYNN